MDNLGNRIKKIREDMGLSKQKFGSLIGVTGQYVGKIENGSSVVSSDVITRICQESGLSADYLLIGNESSKVTDMQCLLAGYAPEQIGIAFDIIKRLALFLRISDSNEIYIKEMSRR